MTRGILFGIAADAVNKQRKPEERRDFQNLSSFKQYLIKMVEEGSKSNDWIAEKVVPTWWPALTILSKYYPKDNEVEALILNLTKTHPALIGDFLGFLNLGLYDSEEAQQLRMSNMESANTNVAKKSIAGLGMVSSEAGVRSLQASLIKRDKAVIDVIEALSNASVSIPDLVLRRELLDDVERTLLALQGGEATWELSLSDLQRIYNSIDVLQSSLEERPQ